MKQSRRYAAASDRLAPAGENRDETTEGGVIYGHHHA